MNVMGLDLSTKTGAVILRAGSPVPLHAEKITYPALGGFDRCCMIARRVNELVESHAVEAVMIEGYAFGNAHTLATLVEIGTVVRYFFWQEQVDYTEVAPGSLKKFVTGVGNASKDQMMLQVFKRWGYEAPDNDLADAYGLGMVGLAKNNCLSGLTKPMQEVLKTLKH